MSKDLYIDINGEQVKVTKEVYGAYMQPIWREEKRRAVRAAKERSFDCYEDETEGFPSTEKLVEDIVMDKMLLEVLLSALETLTDDERGLVNALFVKQQTERDIAAAEGVVQSTINHRKQRLIEKLKKYF